MLMPKKVKYRKQQRGRMTGKAWRGSSLSFGDYGLKALECGWITDREIEAAFERLQAVVAKRQARTAPRFSGHAPALLLAIFHLFGHQHGLSPLSLCLVFGRLVFGRLGFGGLGFGGLRSG